MPTPTPSDKIHTLKLNLVDELDNCVGVYDVYLDDELIWENVTDDELDISEEWFKRVSNCIGLEVIYTEETH